MKTNLIKTLIMQELKTNRGLILNACENELEAFTLYMKQRKDQLTKLPMPQIESMVRNLQNFKKTA